MFYWIMELKLMGLTFGEAFEKEKHEKVFMELLELSINGGLEEECPSLYN